MKHDVGQQYQMAAINIYRSSVDDVRSWYHGLLLCISCQDVVCV